MFVGYPAPARYVLYAGLILQSIHRAADSHRAAIEHVGIDHGGPQVFVTRQFLHDANVGNIFQELNCESVAKGMATGPPDDLARAADLASQNVAVQKQNGAEGLCLGRGPVFLGDVQMRQEAIDFGLTHFSRMAFSLKEDKPSDPGRAGLFRSAIVVSGSQGVSHVQQEFLLMRRRGVDFAGVSGH